MTTSEKIVELCQTMGCRTTDEKSLQDALEIVLRENFAFVQREHRLGPNDVVDFFVESVAVEVKTDGSPMEVTRQLQRYADHDAVTELVLVTSRSKHRTIPLSLRKKPVSVAWLCPL